MACVGVLVIRRGKDARQLICEHADGFGKFLAAARAYPLFPVLIRSLHSLAQCFQTLFRIGLVIRLGRGLNFVKVQFRRGAQPWPAGA